MATKEEILDEIRNRHNNNLTEYLDNLDADTIRKEREAIKQVVNEVLENKQENIIEEKKGFFANLFDKVKSFVTGEKRVEQPQKISIVQNGSEEKFHELMEGKINPIIQDTIIKDNKFKDVIAERELSNVEINKANVMEAIQKDDVKQVKNFLDRDPDAVKNVQFSEDFHQNIFHHIAELHTDESKVFDLLIKDQRFQDQINEMSATNRTALSMAVENNKPGMVAGLLENGADILIEGNDEVVKNALSAKPEVAKAFAENFAEQNAADKDKFYSSLDRVNFSKIPQENHEYATKMINMRMDNQQESYAEHKIQALNNAIAENSDIAMGKFVAQIENISKFNPKISPESQQKLQECVEKLADKLDKGELEAFEKATKNYTIPGKSPKSAMAHTLNAAKNLEVKSDKSEKAESNLEKQQQRNAGRKSKQVKGR